jgi:predicted O-methyltransferase YrrM
MHDSGQFSAGELIFELQQLLWKPAEERRMLQDHGLHLAPANFYSSLPTLDELDASFESNERFPYLDPAVFSEEGLRAGMDEVERQADAPSWPLDDDPAAPSGFFWNNGQFGYSDAVAYYAFLRSRRPATVLEIGSGFSTLIASQALAANGYGEIICIEPYPRPFLEALPHVREVIRKPVQAMNAAWMNDILRDGDVLFIDSTHTVKIGSDCLHIYLRLLPRLRRKLLVHVHDIYLPKGMPTEWARDMHIYWTEQYLLMAYLLDNPKVRTVWASQYNAEREPERMASLVPNGLPAGGGSLWFERVP